jgi:hypothetical protein
MDVFIPAGLSDRSLGAAKHYLIDFSTSLGSGYDLNERIVPKEPQDGYEYTFWGDHNANLKTALTLGIWERPWMKIEYPYPKYAEIGKIESDHFEPQNWKPNYRNAAFERMLKDDAFWACKILACLTEKAIRAVVHEGEFSDPEAERYLAEILIRRRTKILHHYFQQINPLDKFQIVESTLFFENLGLKSGLGYKVSYQYLWHSFDNAAERLDPLGEWRYTGLAKLPIPARLSEYLMVRIRTLAEEAPEWMQNVDIYLRRGDPYSIVGIERALRLEE